MQNQSLASSLILVLHSGHTAQRSPILSVTISVGSNTAPQGHSIWVEKPLSICMVLPPGYIQIFLSCLKDILLCKKVKCVLLGILWQIAVNSCKL